MRSVIKQLSWDSSVFGYAVGHVDWMARPTSDLLDDLNGEGIRGGFRLLYCLWNGGPDMTGETTRRFSYLGGHQSYALRRSELLRGMGSTKGIAVCRHNSFALQQLALESGKRSRFALDPNFRNNEFQAVYGRWLENAFDAGRGGVCCIAGLSGNPQGFLTLEMASDHRHVNIGLLAVHKNFRRSGVGTRLLNFARKLSFETGAESLSVKTQLDNEAGKSFYEKNGFERMSMQTVAHFWCPAPSPLNANEDAAISP